MSSETMLTKEGLTKLQNELQHLKVVRRKEIAERIKEARKYGDISENSEYDEAKNEQAFIEARIKELENMLSNTKIIENKKAKKNKVSLGSTVFLHDLDNDEELTYTLVGSAEADPTENKISNESPIGKAILERKAGETVSVEVPAGIINYKIVKIS